MTSTTTFEIIEDPDPPVAPVHRFATARSHHDSVAMIPNALASEWTKLRSVRSHSRRSPWGTRSASRPGCRQ